MQKQDLSKIKYVYYLYINKNDDLVLERYKVVYSTKQFIYFKIPGSYMPGRVSTNRIYHSLDDFNDYQKRHYNYSCHYNYSHKTIKASMKQLGLHYYIAGYDKNENRKFVLLNIKATMLTLDADDIEEQIASKHHTAIVKSHIIYHHNDLDGETSAVVIGDHLKNSMNIGYNSIRTYRKNYSDDFNNHQFFCNDDVDLTLWFVDLSFNNKTKDKMMDIIKNYNGNHLTINWIDHHQSSLDCGQELYDSIQNYLKEKNKTNITIHFILDNNLSGAGLCYVYSYLQHNLNLTDNSYILKDFIIPDKDHYRSDKEIIAAVFRTMVHIHIPLFIYHVDNYDRWTGDDYDADAFNLGAEYYGYKLSDGVYETAPDIYKNWSNDEECDIDNIIHYGRICYNYTMARYKSEKSYIGHTKINQFKVAYKVGTGNSWNFEDDMMNPQNADCAILVKFLPEKNIFEYSIYASDETKNYVQCNKIAEAFGGGGHIGAAGFMNKDFLFIQDDIDSYIKTNYPDAYAEFAPHVESKDSYNN